jgi:enoyl-CoA hydratase/carnithine racemase
MREQPGHDGAALVRVTISGTTAEVALDNGPLNLMTKPMLRALNDAFGRLAANADLRCMILHGGSARVFCAGSDIKELPVLGKDASEQKILIEDHMLRRLARLPMPTIAAIDATVLGGGLELALACDLRVVKRGISIGLPENNLGGLAGSGSVRITRLIGPSRAKELLFLGEPIAAETALAWGLVNRVVDGSALDAARAMAAKIGARAPLSNRLAKELVDASQDLPLDAGLTLSTLSQQKVFDSADMQEGVAAFFGKRAPTFTGR